MRKWILAMLVGFVSLGCKSTPSIEGIYVWTDTLSVVDVKLKEAGKWTLEENDYLETWLEVHDDGDYSYMLRMTISFVTLGIPDSENEAMEVQRLRPSKRHRGDFDLIPMPGEDGVVGPGGSVPRFLRKLESERTFLEKFKALKGVVPIPAGDREGLLQAAREMLASDEQDPLRRVLYLDVLLRAEELEEFAQRTSEWGDELSREPNAYYAFHTALARAAVAGNARPESSALLDRLAFGNLSYATQLEEYLKLMDLKEFVPRPVAITDPMGGPWFNTQMMMKVFGIESIFESMRGNRRRAFTMACAGYRLAQCHQYDPHPTGYMLGSSFRFVATRFIELHALNTLETAEEIEWAWMKMEELAAWDAIMPEPFFLGLPAELMPFRSPTTASMEEEAVVRGKVGSARMQIVRTIMAARHHLLREGDWPTHAEDFGPLLPEGPPRDPFGDGRIKYSVRGDDFVVWSMGPDAQDDGASAAFEPRNGAPGNGDVYTVVPKERYYPFPAEGFAPTSIQDVESTFPNGLPPDTFADIQGTPLTVIEGTPPIIFSFGPNTDQQRGGKDENGKLEPQYDPTNGTVSVGNLYYRPKQ